MPSKVTSIAHGRRRGSAAPKMAREGGVIHSIQKELLKARDKGKMITTEDILTKLVQQHPKRDEEGMLITVRAQLSRLPKEKHFGIVKEREGRVVRYQAA
jgi:hypothetical protein